MLVCVHVGQAGNQLGGEFWKLVAQQLANSRARRDGGGAGAAAERDYFAEELQSGQLAARAVLVDTEPKAVRAVAQAAAAGGLLRGAATALGHSGRGNNWAHGYRQPGEPGGGPRRGADAGCLSEALSAVERCPRAPDLLLTLSLGGGTGSGLGSRLLESLRSSYPDLFIAVAAFAPRPDGAPPPATGDTPVQSLNLVLAAQFLQEYSDAVFLFQNGVLLRQLERQGGKGGAARAEMGDINAAAAACLAGALFPLPPGHGATAAAASPMRDIVAGAPPPPRRSGAATALRRAPP